MAKQNEHERLIAAAATAALLPIGCKRVGKSRRWISDQRFWIISVEFQPSGWSKGSYLNVAVKWLWHAGPGLDLNSRPVDFVPFESVGQFTPLISGVAERAAREVIILHEKFKSLLGIQNFLVAQVSDNNCWSIYNAAISAGLVGDISTSRSLFSRLEQWQTNGYDWEQRLKSNGTTLAMLLDDRARYRATILAAIEQSRKLFKLPPDPNCLG